jgi:hypothetical protein
MVMILDKKSNENENDSCLKMFPPVKDFLPSVASRLFMAETVRIW